MQTEQIYSNGEEDPGVSVIVPAFNVGATIDDCIMSLLHQEPPRGGHEIIVVDNASTDSTRIRLNRYREQIRIIHESKRGAAAARNAGIRDARRSYLAFIDSDCVAERDWLVKLVAPLSHPEVGIVGGAIESRAHANRIERFSIRFYDQEAAIRECLPYAITASWTSRAQPVRDVGMFDETLIRGQDYDLARRLITASYKITYFREARVRIRTVSTLSGLFLKGLQRGRRSHLSSGSTPDSHRLMRHKRSR